MTGPDSHLNPTLARVEDVPDEAREHHRWLSETDWQFRVAAFERPELRDPSNFEALYPYVLGTHFGFGNHPWPLFLGADRWQALERETVAITRLLLDVPRRIFGTDTQRLADFYGPWEKSVYDILLARPNGIDTAVCRGDYLVRDGQLRCLELNASPNSGGWEIGELIDRYLENPPIRGFIDDAAPEILESDPLPMFLRYLVRATRGHVSDGSIEIGGRLELAMVYGAHPPFPLDTPFRQRVCETFRRVAAEEDLEGELHVTPLSALDVRNGQVVLDDRRIHALLEDGIRVPPQVYRAFKAGRLALFNGPLEPMLSDKRNLALLSENVDSDLFDDDERELVHRILPWTRLLRPGTTRLDGETVDLVDRLLGDRHRWVLKPARESGGRGVTFGDQTEPEAWPEVVERALAAGNWIVQERERASPFVCLDLRDGSLRLHDTIYGLLVYGDLMAGGIMRYQVAEVGGAVNAARSATPGAIVRVRP